MRRSQEAKKKKKTYNYKIAKRDIRTLDTCLTTLDWSLEPNELISCPKMSVMSGCDSPLAMAPMVPIIIKITSSRSAKENSLWNGTRWFSTFTATATTSPSPPPPLPSSSPPSFISSFSFSLFGSKVYCFA